MRWVRISAAGAAPPRPPSNIFERQRRAASRHFGEGRTPRPAAATRWPDFSMTVGRARRRRPARLTAAIGVAQSKTPRLQNLSVSRSPDRASGGDFVRSHSCAMSKHRIVAAFAPRKPRCPRLPRARTIGCDQAAPPIDHPPGRVSLARTARGSPEANTSPNDEAAVAITGSTT